MNNDDDPFWLVQYEDCSRCAGTGKFYGGYTCSECYGTSRVLSELGRQVCRFMKEFYGMEPRRR